MTSSTGAPFGSGSAEYWAWPSASFATSLRGDALQEGQGARALDLELAHVGDVEEPGRLAHGHVLADEPGVLDRHVPAAEGDHLRAASRGGRRSAASCAACRSAVSKSSSSTSGRRKAQAITRPRARVNARRALMRKELCATIRRASGWQPRARAGAGDVSRHLLELPGRVRRPERRLVLGRPQEPHQALPVLLPLLLRRQRESTSRSSGARRPQRLQDELADPRQEQGPAGRHPHPHEEAHDAAAARRARRAEEHGPAAGRDPGRRAAWSSREDIDGRAAHARA